MIRRATLSWSNPLRSTAARPSERRPEANTSTSAEANALHAECFGHPVLGDGEWDWRGQVQGHSLGWVCARDGEELVGFVNVA